jgi:hypothetical protein
MSTNRGRVEGDCELNERGSPNLFESVATLETHRERPVVVVAAHCWGTVVPAQPGGQGCHRMGHRGTWQRARARGGVDEGGRWSKAALEDGQSELSAQRRSLGEEEDD